jgi:hypothetical protein
MWNIAFISFCWVRNMATLDNAEWQDSCLEEQTVGTVGRALCVLVSDFLAESLGDYYTILWKRAYPLGPGPTTLGINLKGYGI